MPPHTAKGEHLVILHYEQPRNLSFTFLSPFNKAVRWNETAASQERIVPDLASEQCFAFRVDGVQPQFLWISDELRQEAPEHHLQRAHPFVPIPDDYRLHGLRRNVVIGSEFESQSVGIADREGFSNALLV